MSYKDTMAGTLTIRIPPDLRRELVRLSREEGVPMGALVRRSLSRLIALRNLDRARAELMPYAHAQGYFTDEDIFKIPT